MGCLISTSFPHFGVLRAGITAVVTAVAACSCGGGSLTGPDGSANDGATDAAPAEGGDAVACVQHVPPGAVFTFHVRNDATDPRYMYFGCGSNPPIAIETAQGVRGIGPESAYFCGYTCDLVFAGQTVPSFCSDCGGGVLKTLQPGATLDIGWDRRTWTQVTIPASCVGLPQSSICALGVAVEGTTINGTVTACAVQPPTISCPTSSVLTTSFVADLSLDAVDISIQ